MKEKPPPELDAIADVVLNYKPKDKLKASEERVKRKAKNAAQKKYLYSCI